jgi:hypothetical protein
VNRLQYRSVPVGADLGAVRVDYSLAPIIVTLPRSVLNRCSTSPVQP